MLGWDTRLAVPTWAGAPLARNNEEAHLAVWAQQHHVPVYAAPHAKGWLRNLNPPGVHGLSLSELESGYARPNSVITPWSRNGGWAVYRA